MNEAWWFLQPGNIILMAVLLAFLSLLVRLRGLAAFMLFVALMVAMLPTVFGASDWLGWHLERRVERPAQLLENVDGIIVLGGSIDWQITEQQNQLTLNDAGERMVAAAALARRYPQAQLVLTGVYRETMPLDFRATPSPNSLFAGPEFGGRQITFIGEARSTYEEALLSLEQLQPAAGENWILVTSAMHMPRASAVFSTMGWNLIPWPVDYRAPTEPRLLNLNMNFSSRLAQFDMVVREWAALIVYERSGRIH